MTKLRSCFLGLTLAALLLSVGSNVHGANIVITVDENGNGTLVNPVSGTFVLPSSMAADPGPGGLASALTYNLLNPPGLVVGDVGLREPGRDPISDLIRFNPNGTLVFYSDLQDGADSLADVGLPTGRYTNFVVILEEGTEGNNGAFYTPTANQPGFVAGANFPVTYHFISDASVAVPEPSTLASAGLAGLLGLVVALRRRKLAIA